MIGQDAGVAVFLPKSARCHKRTAKLRFGEVLVPAHGSVEVVGIAALNFAAAQLPRQRKLSISLLHLG